MVKSVDNSNRIRPSDVISNLKKGDIELNQVAKATAKAATVISIPIIIETGLILGGIGLGILPFGWPVLAITGGAALFGVVFCAGTTAIVRYQHVISLDGILKSKWFSPAAISLLKQRLIETQKNPVQFEILLENGNYYLLEKSKENAEGSNGFYTGITALLRNSLRASSWA